MSIMTIQEIQRHIPHRYPFLLVDQVIEAVDGERLVAIKNVTANEPFFTGHFPENPVMPGVLMVEALAQAAAILMSMTAKNKDQDQDGLYLLTGIDKARFRRMVIPGDQLRLEVEVIRSKHPLYKTAAKATVNGELACSVEIACVQKDSE